MPDRPVAAAWPRAVLWDMDGTLVDTEPYWIASEYDLIEAHGGTWSEEHALNLVGNDLLVSGRYIVEHSGIDLTPSEVVEALLDAVVAKVEREVPFRPGARELLADLGAAGVLCGLVTMSYQRFADPVLAVLPDDAFATVVTGDQVSQGKPHPEPYLEAMARLGVSPHEVLAIEDSGTGAASAEAAGCTVLVVPCHVEVPTGPGRHFVDSLVSLDVPGLAALQR